MAKLDSVRDDTTTNLDTISYQCLTLNLTSIKTRLVHVKWQHWDEIGIKAQTLMIMLHAGGSLKNRMALRSSGIWTWTSTLRNPQGMGDSSMLPAILYIMLLEKTLLAILHTGIFEEIWVASSAIASESDDDDSDISSHRWACLAWHCQTRWRLMLFRIRLSCLLKLRARCCHDLRGWIHFYLLIRINYLYHY